MHLPEHGFNPRTRVGCDKRDLQLFIKRLRFNPRTRVGCDGRLFMAGMT